MVKFKNIKKPKEKEEKPKKEAKKKQETKKEEMPGKKKEFPNILRIITERRFWLHVINVLALVGMLLVGIGLGKYVEKAQAIKAKRDGLAIHIQYLQTLSQTYPHDRDILLEIATEEYQLGNLKEADIYIEKTLTLDPNFLPALKLKGLILTRGK